VNADVSSSNDDVFDRIHGFFVASMSQELTEERVAEIEQLLRSSDDACRLYAKYVEASVLLPFVLPSLPDAAGETAECDCVPRESKTTHAPILDDAFPGATGRTANFGALPYLVVALIAYLATLAAWHWRPVDHRELARNDAAQATAIEEANVAYVGRVTGMAYCKWAEGSRPASHYERIFIGQRFNLDSGLVEITYDSGARVILQGPVTYEIDSNNGGYVFVGKLSGKIIAETGRGFTVRTPTAKIVDVGTEFALEVTPNGAVETVVFSGMITLAPVASREQKGGVATAVPAAPQVLREGQAAKVVNVAPRSSNVAIPRIQAVSKVAKSDRFVRTMPTVPAEILIGPVQYNGSFEDPVVGPDNCDQDAGDRGPNVFAKIRDVVPKFWSPTSCLQTKGMLVRGVTGTQYVVLEGPSPVLTTQFDGVDGHPPARKFEANTTYILTADIGSPTRGTKGFVCFESGTAQASRTVSVPEANVMAPMAALELDTSVKPEFVGQQINLTFVKTETSSDSQLYVDNVMLKAVPAKRK
jgi:hypothetical protein